MHDGCSGAFESGKQILDKIRMLGFNTNFLQALLLINCANCGVMIESCV